MTESPSELLGRAADLIRDLAAQATKGPWKRYQDEGYVSVYAGRYPVATQFEIQPDKNAEWVAALSPAVAPHLEQALRNEAEQLTAAGLVDDPQHAPDPSLLALARALTGGA